MRADWSKGFGSTIWKLVSDLRPFVSNPLTSAVIGGLISGLFIVGGPAIQERFDKSVAFELEDTVAASCFVAEELHVSIADVGTEVYSNWLVVDATKQPSDRVSVKLPHAGFYRVSVTGTGFFSGGTSDANGDFSFNFKSAAGKRYLLNSIAGKQQCAAPPGTYEVKLAG